MYFSNKRYNIHVYVYINVCVCVHARTHMRVRQNIAHGLKLAKCLILDDL